MEIVTCPIIREEDGIALSSRNAYLSAEERLRARAISVALFDAKKTVAAGERFSVAIIQSCLDKLKKAGSRVDYVEIVDPATLERVENHKRRRPDGRGGLYRRNQADRQHPVGVSR